MEYETRLVILDLPVILWEKIKDEAKRRGFTESQLVILALARMISNRKTGAQSAAAAAIRKKAKKPSLGVSLKKVCGK